MLKITFPRSKEQVRGPAIFLDRDGVINCRRPGGYVLEWSQFIFVPGIREALKQLSFLQLPMIIISNQAAVGKGLLEPSVLEDITSRLHQLLIEEDAFLSAAYYCPHRSDENCPCRKPKPGLLQEAAADLKVDLNRSIFIGDSETDIQAAQAAGCHPIAFGSGNFSCSASPGWAMKIPVVRSADGLFDVAVNCLENTVRATTRDLAK